MKEYISFSTNTHAVISAGALQAHASMIIILRDPSSRLETVRFDISPASMRNLAEKLVASAADAEALIASLSAGLSSKAVPPKNSQIS